jgi:predicted ATPase/class 3 adenylate cyclase
VAELPSGTVSLLFSDIEGSTVLLSRLGATYGQALDGQRQVLRKAWADHGGAELGTEGDSFFVVFATAEAAVRAATQAQRELAAFDWPAGEQVRVRMGIHTGTPTLHDGGYVGMDVHRAARIAGAAHGGQVVLSAATAELVSGCLPEGVRLVDLGSHHLKDISSAEHVFQLAIGNLQRSFPPLKTLGAVASLPRPNTPLIGRDGELEELTARLSSPNVRLVTLTGPGGSGKTRLAIGVAQVLVARFPDGVYFVPLASVTSAEVMWTTVAEALGVPPEARMPPAFLTHVAHRTALLVLDNLEQIPAADAVVRQLLEAAPDVVVLATSRRPLRITGEYDHGVPPLELPEQGSAKGVEHYGAVRMFVEHARMSNSRFQLTPGNTADVIQLCRRLDGLPLAIELAAARSKLLSPAALLARLHTALDMAARGSQGPSRQQTLRSTISWSYDLLTDSQQAFFRRLAVFVGGADIAALDFVTPVNDSDPLDLIADLIDASLVTRTDDADGEPRFGMLETIRAYAYDQLRGSSELDATKRRHVEYFLTVAQRLHRLLSGGRGDQRLEARQRFELELDNMREALRWVFRSGNDAPSADEADLGLKLCAELTPLWDDSGYFREERQWLEQATNQSGTEDSMELGLCQVRLARLLILQGDLRQAQDVAKDSVRTWRRLNKSRQLSDALSAVGRCEELSGNMEAASQAFEESLSLAQQSEDAYAMTRALGNLALLEHDKKNYGRSLELMHTSVPLLLQLGDELGVLQARHNMACTLRQMGRLEDAYQQMRQQISDVVKFGDAEMVMVLAEDYAALLAERGDHRPATHLLGAVDAMRQRSGTPRDPAQEREVNEPFHAARAALGDSTWEREYQVGATLAVDDALAAVAADRALSVD